MGKIIGICSQKGGVGKSTTANALGAGLHSKGYKVLYVDLDAQGNLTYSVGASDEGLTCYEVLKGEATAKAAIQETPQGDFIASSTDLSGIDLILKDDYRLKKALDPIKKSYDFIILDTPPALGIVTINALTASDEVVIPVQADPFSLQGVGQLAWTLQAVQGRTNKALKIKGILITRYNPRAILSRDMKDLLEETAGSLHTKVFDTKIRECMALKEAIASQQDIFTYNHRSNASADYMSFIEELLKEE